MNRLGKRIVVDVDEWPCLYILVASGHADAAKGFVAIDSPVGINLANAQVGDEIIIEGMKGVVASVDEPSNKVDTTAQMTNFQFQIIMSLRVDPDYTPFAAEYTEIQQMIRQGWLNRHPGKPGKYVVTESGHRIYLARRTPWDQTQEKNRKEAKERLGLVGHGGVSHYRSVMTPIHEPKVFRQQIEIRPATKSLRPYIWTLEQLEAAAKKSEAARQKFIQEMLECWD